MQFIPTKTPLFIKRLLPKYCWDINSTNEKKIYLTFDDGPIPKVTAFVLHQLAQYQAKATFFCIGNNIEKHPHLLQQIHNEGHTIGNHTMDHSEAWKTTTEAYLTNIKKCHHSIHRQQQITATLFRPPYGQISYKKTKAIRQLGYTIVLWDVLAKDWQATTTPQQCTKNVIENATSGSIIVFHDSTKAWKNMSYALPKVLEHFTKRGYTFEGIPEMSI